jgi:hypothetical protein
MRKIVIFCCLLPLTLTIGHKAIAQDTVNMQASKAPENVKSPASPVHYYHLDFVIEELGSDGKSVNSRSYSTTVNTEDRNTMSIRTGSRIPIVTGSFAANGKENEQFQFLDVGVNIDVRNTHEIGNKLALILTTELTGLSQPIEPGMHWPVTRQNKWQATVLIPIGKPSIAFTSDSLDNKGGTRVVITATPLQ